FSWGILEAITSRETAEVDSLGDRSKQTVEPFSKTNTCRLNNCCALKGILAQARNAFIKTLRAHTLADALNHPGLAAQFKRQLAST
ncbi:MAG: hypothetical protein AAF212_04455, partial [Verrucomicrobiota bacterium]